MVEKMYNSDIRIEEIELREIIEKLKKETDNINTKITNINSLIRSLDESVWISPEKKQIDESLIPFIDDKEQIKEELTNCIITLKNALSSYLESDLKLKVDASKLENIMEI